MSEFQPGNSYICCGNGCNAHFQNQDEAKLREICALHNQKCAIATPYKNDPNAFYFVEPTPTPSKEAPNWKSFRLELSGDIAYHRIRIGTFNTPGQLAGEWLGNAAAVESQEWAEIAAHWAVLIDYTPLLRKPLPAEIARWNQIAISNAMPFKFEATGKIKVEL